MRRDSRRRTTSDARWVISESSWGVGCVCGEDVWSWAYRVANSYSTLQWSNTSDMTFSFSRSFIRSSLSRCCCTSISRAFSAASASLAFSRSRISLSLISSLSRSRSLSLSLSRSARSRSRSLSLSRSTRSRSSALIIPPYACPCPGRACP